MTRAIALVFLAGCSSWIRSSVPDEARELTADERGIVVEHVERWETIVGPLGECREYAGRLMVIDADEPTMLERCWRNPPSHYVPDPERTSRYGRAAGCVQQRGGVGLIVAYQGLSQVEHADVIGHEATHLLGHCTRTWHLDHRNPALWGPTGVHPL